MIFLTNTKMDLYFLVVILSWATYQSVGLAINPSVASKNCSKLFSERYTLATCNNWTKIMNTKEIKKESEDEVRCLLSYDSFVGYCEKAKAANLSLDIKQDFVTYPNSSQVCDGLNTSNFTFKVLKNMTEYQCKRLCYDYDGTVNQLCNFAHFFRTYNISPQIHPVVNSNLNIPSVSKNTKDESKVDNTPVNKPETPQVNKKVDITPIKNNNNETKKSPIVPPPENKNQANINEPTEKKVPPKVLPQNPEPQNVAPKVQNEVQSSQKNVEQPAVTNVNNKPLENANVDKIPEKNTENAIKTPEEDPENQPENGFEDTDMEQEENPVEEANVDLTPNNPPSSKKEIPRISSTEVNKGKPNLLDADKSIQPEINPEEAESDDEEGESYFFSYFTVLMCLVVVGYVGYHNRQKILALLLEGNQSRRQQRARRPNSANYHKLDSNLEEAMSSSCNKTSSNIIY